MPASTRTGSSSTMMAGGAILLYLYPTIAGFLARSEAALVLGRYSPALALLNLWNLALVALVAWSLQKRRSRVFQVCCVLMAATTLLIPTNNQMQALPGISIILPALRLFLAAALLGAEFGRWRRLQARPSGLCVAAAATIAVLAVIDLAIVVQVQEPLRHAAPIASGFREDYDLAEIGPSDLILVGDSFVWGTGVGDGERFGDRLDQLYAEEDSGKRVYSLGITGQGTAGYVRILGLVPEVVSAERVILSFFMNDLPPRPTLRRQLPNYLMAIGLGAPSLRAGGDQIARMLLPTAEVYLDEVVRDYDEGDSTFEKRWSLLLVELERFRDKALRVSGRPPVLLILPIMVDFHTYPLVAAHRRLGEAAEDLGYQVLDLLPVFRRELIDGRDYWVTRRDDHFDASVHELVAKRLQIFLLGT